MDVSPVTARSLEPYYKIDGDGLERCYKNHLSGYRTWDQLDHADDWVMHEANMGEYLCIDETSFDGDLFTILSNKEGHCRKGSIIAMVRGTRACDVISVLNRIPEPLRMSVKEVTMDFSDSMRTIVRKCFPNAVITIDCFHVVKRSLEAVEELRLKDKREAITKVRKEKAEHVRRQKKNAYQRKQYRKRHPKKYPGKKRGRKPNRTGFQPSVLQNGDTLVELYTRCRGLLCKSGDQWSESQKERARLLFEKSPNIAEAYGLIQSLRAVFSSKTINREQAKVKLHAWYKKVAQCTLREVKAVRDTIKAREEEVLNYFISRSTNASAESLNSKLKRFRAQLHGVVDNKFFMFRVMSIFG